MYWVTLKACTLVVAGLAAVASPLDKRAVPQDTYDDLDRFMKYASSAYAESCPSPLGNTLVATIRNGTTSTEGYIARDDNRRELVVAFRGSQQIHDFILTDANIILVPYVSRGVDAPVFTMVHFGFLLAYNSVANQVISNIREQLMKPNQSTYSIRTTGHSLGGALSSLAAVSLKSNFPNTLIKMYTYGQPRTGDGRYANYVNTLFGTNAYRNVHTTDIVARIPPLGLTSPSYQHHAYEYWQTPDPASPGTVTMCDSSGEDPNCSNSFGITSINFTDPGASHVMYFNRATNTTFCQ